MLQNPAAPTKITACAQPRAFVAFALLFGMAGSVKALEVHSLLITHEAGRYELHLQARLPRSPSRVFAVLTAFQKAPLLNPAIKSMVVVPEDSGLRSESHTDGCFIGLCRDLFQVQRLKVVSAAQGGRIDAITLPVAGSSFSSGENHIEVRPDGSGSLFTLASSSVPSFWLPPWLGPYAVQTRLREEALTTLANLERLAGE